MLGCSLAQVCPVDMFVSNLWLQLIQSFVFSFTVEQQKTDSQHFPSRPFTHRRPGPPTMGPPKNHVSSPLSNQLATIHSLFNSAQTQTLLQSHSQGTCGTVTSGSGGNSSSAARSSIGEMSGRNNVIHGNKGDTGDSKLLFFRENKWNETTVVGSFSQRLWFLFVYRFIVTLRVGRLSGAGWLLGGGGRHIRGRCFVRHAQQQPTAVEKTTGFESPKGETERWGSTTMLFCLRWGGWEHIVVQH